MRKIFAILIFSMLLLSGVASAASYSLYSFNTFSLYDPGSMISIQSGLESEGVDLYIRTLSTEPVRRRQGYVSGVPFRVKLLVKNIGNEKASNFDVSYTNLGKSETRILGTGYSLSAHSEMNFEFEISELRAGNFDYEFEVNKYSGINENNKGNNKKTISVDVKPNMEVSLISPKSKEFDSDDSIEFRYMVGHRANLGSQSFTCRLYLGEELKPTGDIMSAVPAYIDMLTGFTSNKFVVSGLDAGDYEWNVQCTNSDGDKVFADNNGEFSIKGHYSFSPPLVIDISDDEDEDEEEEEEDEEDEEEDEEDEDEDDDEDSGPNSVITMGSPDYGSGSSGYRGYFSNDHDFEEDYSEEFGEEVSFKDSRVYVPLLMSSSLLALVLIFLLLVTMANKPRKRKQ